MKIVVASDSFKGSLTSAEVGEAVSKALHNFSPSIEVITLAVADGGEGTLEAITSSLNTRNVECRVSDPLLRQITAIYAVARIDGNPVAIIDMASSCGLTLLSECERSATLTSSSGLGEMIRHAYDSGVRDFIIGIGGSATCDGGIGLLAALGYKFYNHKGDLLPNCGKSLPSISKIVNPKNMEQYADCRFRVLCDVDNPLYGDYGAARVFAPQKGASAEQVDSLDMGLRQFANLVADLTGIDYSTYSGAGAAGGVGFAFKALLGGELTRGADLVLDMIEFDKHINDADLVITGEGSIDSQTLQGKLPIAVCRRAQKRAIPTIAIAGIVKDREQLLAAGFRDVISITPAGMPISEAMKPETAKANISRAVASLF